jgi:hypothetical protein
MLSIPVLRGSCWHGAPAIHLKDAPVIPSAAVDCQRAQRALRYGLSCNYSGVLYLVRLLPPPSDRSARL